MENYSVWQLIQNGHFTEACNKADHEFFLKKDISILRNKIYALLHLKKYEECVLVCEKLIELDLGQTDSDFIFSGIAYWLIDDKSSAVKMWQNGTKAKYTDAAGGIELQIFLFFASLKLNNDTLKKNVIKKIEKLLKSKLAINYPAALGKFLLNEIDEDHLLKLASKTPILKERQLCQIYFTIALKSLQNSEMETYFDKLKDAVSFKSSSYIEHMYYLAAAELDYLNS